MQWYFVLCKFPPKQHGVALSSWGAQQIHEPLHNCSRTLLIVGHKTTTVNHRSPQLMDPPSTFAITSTTSHNTCEPRHQLKLLPSFSYCSDCTSNRCNTDNTRHSRQSCLVWGCCKNSSVWRMQSAQCPKTTVCC